MAEVRGGPPKNKKTCRACGERFQPTTGFQKFCTAECRKVGEQTERICAECGETFSRVNWSRARFCSPRCANTATARKRKGKKGRFGNGKPAYPKPGVCKNCRAKFTREKPADRCCSPECSKQLSVENRRKTLGTIPPWGCKTKGEEFCRNCGYPATHLHHIVPRSKTKLGHRDMRNGLPLCRDCHYGWHHQTVVIYSDRLKSEERAFAVELTSEWWVNHRYPERPYDLDDLDGLTYAEQAQIVEDCGGISIALPPEARDRYLTNNRGGTDR